MYIDVAILMGIAVLIACCFMVGYLGWYGYKRINEEVAQIEMKNQIEQ